jgi:hypothetical protein
MSDDSQRQAGASDSTVKVVDFPRRAAERAKGRDVERINQFEFFELGETLQQIKTLEGQIDGHTAFFPIYRAHLAMQGVVDGKPLELTVSKGCATRLRDELWTFIDTHFRGLDGEGTRTWAIPVAGAPAIQAWRWSDCKTALTDFETIFREEMREAAIYRVPPRGIYDTGKLVDAADQSFPAEIAMAIPLKTKEDWKAAGRCLAFNLLSASGFHVARAVEGTIEAYYQQSAGIAPDAKKATLHSWGDYIKALEAAREATPPKTALVPSEKVIAEIQQMKDDYRNPIAHPRIVLSEPDARMLFANGESLIIAMAQEIKAVMPQPSALSSAFGFASELAAIASGA